MNETTNKLVEEAIDHIKWFKTLTHAQQEAFRIILRVALTTAYKEGEESIELDPTSLRAQQRVKGHHCVTCGTPMEKINDNTWATACEHGKGLRFSSG